MAGRDRLLWAVLAACLCGQGVADPLPSAPGDEVIVDTRRGTFVLRDGQLYRRTLFGGERLVRELFDPDHLAESYRREDGGRLLRVDPTSGQSVPVFDSLSTTFDTGAGLADLIGLESGWTSFNLQSPAAPTIRDYVELRREILSGTADFLDNAIRPVDGALRFEAVPAGGRTGVSKASLYAGLLHAGIGDRVTISGRFRLVEGTPVSLIDLEASYIEGGPGIRVMVDDDGTPWVELKWIDRRSWRPEARHPLTVGQWVDISFEATLHPSDGTVSLSLDGDEIIRGTGPTLPLDWMVYDRLEVGISATVDDHVVLDLAELAFERTPD